MHGTKVAVGKGITLIFSFPGESTVNEDILCQDVISELPVKIRIVAEDPDTVCPGGADRSVLGNIQDQFQIFFRDDALILIKDLIDLCFHLGI